MRILQYTFLVALGILTYACTEVEKNQKESTAIIPSSQLNKIVWHWADDFEDSEKEKLMNWLREITKYTRQTIGTYQFDVHYYFHLSDGNEPVPYAHTSRKRNQQAVHFYVNPKFSLKEFMNDWTAQHEISHLSLPFIKRDHMWFSEGYATYLSRKIMVKQGIFTEQEFDSIYYNKIGNDSNLYEYPSFTIPALANQLKKRHQYPSIYYLGSSYFYLIDKKLQSDYQTDLPTVISVYQTNGRLKDESLYQVLSSLDKIVGSKVFSDLFKQFSTEKSASILSFFTAENRAI